MFNFICGTVFGIIVATIGFSGMAPSLDSGVRFIQEQTIQHAKPQLPNPDK